MANLFFVCMAEEALFRGYLQQRLSQWLGPGRLIVAALVFGAAHLAGGMLMVIRDAGRRDHGLAWMGAAACGCRFCSISGLT